MKWSDCLIGFSFFRVKHEQLKNKTMKKTYKNPEMKVVRVQVVAQMLAASPGYGGTTPASSGNLAPEFDAYWDE